MNTFELFGHTWTYLVNPDNGSAPIMWCVDLGCTLLEFLNWR